jgi:hypothetical protein
MSGPSAEKDARVFTTITVTHCAHTWLEGSDACIICGETLTFDEDDHALSIACLCGESFDSLRVANAHIFDHATRPLPPGSREHAEEEL